MKPKRLEFCGINSFSRKAEIDFAPLLSGGIFGIFGDTGSGKTTILDSMIFALYGRADRVKDGTAADLINYNCDRATVVFEFETALHDGRHTYRIEREIRRKNAVQTLRLYERTESGLSAVSEGVKNTNARIEEIVGLSFDEFKKCIALPQGEFAQFLKATKGERLRLISHLFGLEKYGIKLSERLKERYAEARSVCDRKAGELKGYEEIEEGASAKLRLEMERLLAEKKKLDAAYETFYRGYESLRAAYERYTESTALRKELERLLANGEQIEEKKRMLQRLPAAQQIAAAVKERAMRQEQASRAQKAKAEAERESAAAAEECEALKRAFNAAENEAARTRIAARLAVCSRLKEDERKLAQERAELARRREEAAAAQKRRGAAQAVLDECGKRERALAARAAEFAELPLEEFLRQNFDSALLAGEYREALAYFQEKQRELRSGYGGGALFERVDVELCGRIDHYTKRLGTAKTDNAAQLFEEYRKIEKARAAYVSECGKIAMEKNRAEAALSEAEAACVRAEQTAAQGEERVREGEAALSEALGGAASAAALERELLQQQQQREEEAKLFSKKFSLAEERGKNAVAAAAAAAAQTAQREEECAAARQRCGELLSASSFSEEGEALTLAAAVQDAEAAERAVAEYEKEVLSVQAKLSVLTAQGEVQPVAEEEVAARKAELDALTLRRQAAAESAAVFGSRIADLEKREKQKKELEKQFAAAEGELALVEQLRDLLRGNGLTEFLAGEYLAEIAASATKLLLRLTNGRYFLQYDQGFLVGDNLCGGERRSVNTLSGGETFLVSLSLALALSSAIYAKSLKPIEFFFLDEGFGTLDEKLIDTVMDSLEKLKDSHFTVGLISHVDELRHRIENKILVRGAAENGSSEIGFGG